MPNDTNQPLLAIQNPFATRSQDVTVMSVEQLNLQIKQLLEGELNSIWIKGEISNFKAHTSGHFYFSLKDPKSQISAVMFRGFNSKIKFKVHDGLEVLVKGRVSVYEPRGNYQILCEHMEPVGAGALQKAFEELKLKLKAEGLFDSQRKRPLPTHPNKIAVISSPTGAAIQDFFQIINRRAPFLEVILIPTLVQGEAAPEKIMQALRDAWKIPNLDVIVLARGGGSIEDLWGFNNEDLARLIAQSPVPTISAIGHEIDFTISDFVADLRAPTPSAAAELVAKSSRELEQKLTHMHRFLLTLMDQKIKNFKARMLQSQAKLKDPKKTLQDLILRNDDLQNRLQLALDNYLDDLKHRVALAFQKLPHPQTTLNLYKSRQSHLQASLSKAIKNLMDRKRVQLTHRMSLLDSYSPLKVLDRGYSILSDQGRIVRSVNELNNDKKIEIKLSDGSVAVTLSQVERK